MLILSYGYVDKADLGLIIYYRWPFVLRMAFFLAGAANAKALRSQFLGDRRVKLKHGV